MSKRQRGADVTNQADVARRGLVSVNRLDYTLQPDLSVAVARSAKRHFFQQQEYTPGNRAICILNSGAEYIDPQNSFLRFDVTIPSTAVDHGLNLGCGSGANFIKQIILTSRSGDELERIEQVSQLAPILDRYMNSTDWINTTGEHIGYYNGKQSGSTITGASTEDFRNSLTVLGGWEGYSRHGVWNEVGANDTLKPQIGAFLPSSTNTRQKTFIIPLSCLSGMFRSFDRLIPSMLASGMRIEIEFETGGDAGIWQPTTVSGQEKYTVSNLEIVCDQYQLTDSIMRVLNEEAAMRGLEVVFSTWYNHDAAQGAKNSYNVQIRKAVSRALGVLSRIQYLPNTDPKKDNHLSAQNDLLSYQVRVGALYFPQQAIKSTDIKTNAAELYQHTLRGFGKYKTPQAPSGVSLRDYEGDATHSLMAIYTDLERSNTQKLTGIPINNSRVAEIMLTRVSSVPTCRLNTYLHYVRLLRVFLQNVEVEE